MVVIIRQVKAAVGQSKHSAIVRVLPGKHPCPTGRTGWGDAESLAKQRPPFRERF